MSKKLTISTSDVPLPHCVSV